MTIRSVMLHFVCITAIFFGPTISRAGHHFENGNGYGQSQDWSSKHGKRHQGGRAEAFVANDAYVAACGGCHWAYVPQLLPRASWETILAQSEDHFGNALALSQQDKSVLSAYLSANAADATSLKLGRKIMRSLNGVAPLQIRAIPYILHKHQGISPAVFSRKSINSLANCIACHPAAASARFDDDNVVIPAQ